MFSFRSIYVKKKMLVESGPVCKLNFSLSQPKWLDSSTTLNIIAIYCVISNSNLFVLRLQHF